MAMLTGPPRSSTSSPSLLDFADQLWFSSSVIGPFPSLSISCLPAFLSQYPDSSTFLTQLMALPVNDPPSPASPDSDPHEPYHPSQYADGWDPPPPSRSASMGDYAYLDDAAYDALYRKVEEDEQKLQGQDVQKERLPKEWQMMPKTLAQVHEQYEITKGSTHGEGCKEVDVPSAVSHHGDGSCDKGLIPSHKRFYKQVMHGLPCSLEGDIKEHLKCWAQVVASGLQSKALMHAKQGSTK